MVWRYSKKASVKEPASQTRKPQNQTTPCAILKTCAIKLCRLMLLHVGNVSQNRGLRPSPKNESSKVTLRILYLNQTNQKESIVRIQWPQLLGLASAQTQARHLSNCDSQAREKEFPSKNPSSFVIELVCRQNLSSASLWSASLCLPPWQPFHGSNA